METLILHPITLISVHFGHGSSGNASSLLKKIRKITTNHSLNELVHRQHFLGRLDGDRIFYLLWVFEEGRLGEYSV